MKKIIVKAFKIRNFFLSKQGNKTYQMAITQGNNIP